MKKGRSVLQRFALAALYAVISAIVLLLGFVTGLTDLF